MMTLGIDIGSLVSMIPHSTPQNLYLAIERSDPTIAMCIVQSCTKRLVFNPGCTERASRATRS